MLAKIFRSRWHYTLIAAVDPGYILVSRVLDVRYVDQARFRDFELPAAFCALQD